MRPLRLVGLLLTLCLALGGCQVSGEVENQAYVLVLGVERLEDSRLALTARVPKIGKTTDSKEKGGEGSPYLTFSVAGDTWANALEALQLATPRQTNLSHIEMLVVSDVLAREAGFPELIRRITETPHLYATARLVVCEASAREFIDAGETVIGTRMSAELRAMLKHYADMGYVPDSTLADAYFAVNSIYSDPVAICARVDNGGDTNLQTLDSPMKQRYGGAALFRDGVMVGTLPLEQTRLLNLIRGQSSAFAYECSGKSYELTPEGGPELKVDMKDDEIELKLNICLSTLDDACREDAERLERNLQTEIEALIHSCQSIACDPFGFAEAAAGHFATVPEWMTYDWRERYARAGIDVCVAIQTEGGV